MPLVDTSILLFAVNADSPLMRSCESCLASLRQGQAPWHCTWSVAYESPRLATHPRVFTKPLSARQAWRLPHTVFDSPGFSMLTASARHPGAVSEAVRQFPGVTGNLRHDAGTAILMREHGIGGIGTRDAGFHCFPFLEVVDPAR